MKTELDIYKDFVCELKAKIAELQTKNVFLNCRCNILQNQLDIYVKRPKFQCKVCEKQCMSDFCKMAKPEEVT